MRPPRRNRYYGGPPSDHFDGARFFSTPEPARRAPLDFVRFVAGQVARPWGRARDALPTDRPPARADALRLVLVGHSSVLVQLAGLNLLVDPVWSDRLGPGGAFGPRRRRPPGVAWEDLPPVDAVLLTHDHWDHLDGPTLRRLAERFGCPILAPLGVDATVRAYAPGAAVTALDWGGAAPLSDRLTAHLVPAFHWSGRGLLDRRHALWGSWVVTDARGGVLLHVGDTAYGDGGPPRAVRERFGAPDVALIPIGAYRPRWHLLGQHVDPEEALRILLDCGARQAYGHHWGAFQLTWEGPDDPPRDLAAALARHGLPPERFRPLVPGAAVLPPWPA